MKGGSDKVRRARQTVWILAIIVVSTTVAMIVTWRAPGINLYARDRLMRARGPLTPPDDIVIVAMDEASIARFGSFPWSRALTSRAVDAISQTQPKAIALDVLYSEVTTNTDDLALAESIKKSGNSVVAAQLIETLDDTGAPGARWLRPLPLIENSAAGVGHVNVSTEADGQARELSLRKADDQGQSLWAIAVETVRVGEGISPNSVRETVGGIQIGSRIVPIAREVATTRIVPQDANSRVSNLPADRMAIDYLGPPRSFGHQTFSFADVLEGHVSPQSFRGKYVLIGATAATLGDHVASPFTHGEGAAGEQYGELMPGVEVLANALNTILRSRHYHETPDWLAALLAALVAAAVLGLLALAQGRYENVKQIGALLGLLTIILAASYFVFVRWLIVPPVVPALLSFATAAPLALLRRSLGISSDLDVRIAELTSANELLLFSAPGPEFRNNHYSNPVTLLAHLTEADMVAIYVHDRKAGGRYRVAVAHGSNDVPSLTEDEIQRSIQLAQPAGPSSLITDGGGSRIEELSSILLDQSVKHASIQREGRLILRLGSDEQPLGALIIGRTRGQIRSEILRLCVEIASAYITNMNDDAGLTSLPAIASWRFPRGVEWKARALGLLNRRLLARARFVDRALRAVEDGLIVADISGRIAFANSRAAQILGIPDRMLVGSDLFHQLAKTEQRSTNESNVERNTGDMLMRLFVGRTSIEREITVGNAPPRYYMLRISVVTTADNGTGKLLGLVAALSNVTEQHELQEMKTDVMALVTHELLTPLTAIQGMSELLAQFEVDEERRREMHLAINDEAKRLSRMIGEYMDITRLESGAHPLRLAPIRIVPLVERVLLLLAPVAAQRQIMIVRRLMPELPALLVDADLVAQALTNLIANAIKYSPAQTEIVVEARDGGDALLVEVRDHGHGISADSLPHIFEKFYRVARVEDADVPGTGLGLALVREIVALHGGRVTVESTPGIGSTFSVRLPLPASDK